MRSRAMDQHEQNLGQNKTRRISGTANRYYSPQFFIILFFISGFVCWGLFGYNQRSMASLIRGEPRGRKYLNTGKGKVSHSSDARDATLYVIPGGGSGMGNDGDGVLNYPEWTKRRTIAAVKHAKEAGRDEGIYFLALSAGSLNSPNRLSGFSKQIVFECTHTINHLVELGVAREQIFGDFISWDTITNAMVLRMTLKGILEKIFGYIQPGEEGMDDAAGSSWASYFQYNSYSSEVDTNEIKGTVNIEVFISDFHLERVQAAFEWVLSLTPSLIPYVKLKMHSVGSEGIPGLSYFGAPDKWGNPAPISEVAKIEFMERQAHEKRGLEQIKAHRSKIKSESAFYGWLLLGDHQGIAKYLDGTYHRSKGAGW